MTMADRIAIMDQGYISQVGSPVDVYESPNSRMVAEFIGSVNLFDGRIVEDQEDHMVLHCDDLDCPIYIGHGVTSGVDERSMLFALRPEKTLMTREQPEGEVNWSSGVVHDIAYLGGHTVYYVRLPSGKVVQSTLVNTERRAERPTWDDPVYVHWASDSGVVLRS